MQVRKLLIDLAIHAHHTHFLPNSLSVLIGLTACTVVFHLFGSLPAILQYSYKKAKYASCTFCLNFKP